MKLLLLLVFAGHLTSSMQILPDDLEPTTTTEEYETTSFVDAHWLELPLDHFNLFDNRTWEMRYFINDRFFEEGGPLFVEIGGEWTVSGSDTLDIQLYKLADEHHGMLVATEHRYYGKSLPFSNFTTENLQYLQLEQALEDLAYLIEYFKASTPGLTHSKVVVHGCSYAGMLATWMRLRFPHIVDIAYASSAPLGVGLDYPEYYEAIHDVYANVSGRCIDTIAKGFNMTEKLLRTDDGRKLVKDALRKWSCGDVDYMNSGDILYTMLSVLNVQYDPHRFEEVSCLVLLMDADDSSAFERLANLVILKSKSAGSCDSEEEADEENQDGLAWHYQTCTEVGFFQTLSSRNARHPFAIDLTIEESVESCVMSFGEGISEELIRTGIETVIRRYGGRRPKVTKVLSVQGSSDPWKVLGKYEEEDAEAPVIILRGSHCVDTTDRDDDPPELIEARRNIRSILSKWIREV